MPKIISWLPLICGIMLAAGVMMGTKIGGAGRTNSGSLSFEKIKAVLSFVNSNYVDSINESKLTDQALVSILQALDPHSDYFTAAQVKEMSEPMKGNFEGVGIEYNFIRDTLVVMVVIPNGPSETAGLRAGDRILSANDTSIIGYSNNENFVKTKLRGPANTPVNVSYRRPSTGKTTQTTITRGSIPIYSVDAYYMLNEETGYLRLTRFSETSYAEFQRARDTLLKAGMKNMVLDLRGNGGGLLDAATDIADEFLSDGKMIVYTKGRSDGEQRTIATKKGKLEKIPLAVLVDENSASASEILAGALQDNDRGVIIGRRTFGKGLVQIEQGLSDGSAFRLTIARYYTPTGRCIQKPYDKGLDAYAAEEQVRYDHGELYNRDSIHFPDSLKYKTPGGKTVYGGGGIMPDNFVPFDSTGGSGYLDQLFRKDIFVIWALNYSDKNGVLLQKKGRKDFRKNFEITDQLIEQLILTGEQNKVKRNDVDIKRSLPLIRRYMKAYLARLIWDDAAYAMMWNDNDAAINAAVMELEK